MNARESETVVADHFAIMLSSWKTPFRAGFSLVCGGTTAFGLIHVGVRLIEWVFA